jgi:hypothetical protein
MNVRLSAVRTSRVNSSASASRRDISLQAYVIATLFTNSCADCACAAPVAPASATEANSPAGFPGAFAFKATAPCSSQTRPYRRSPIFRSNFRAPSPSVRVSTGRVDIVSLDVAVPDRIPVTSQPLAGTKHVDATKTATARVALDKKAKARGKRKPAFDADIDLTIAAPDMRYYPRWYLDYVGYEIRCVTFGASWI